MSITMKRLFRKQSILIIVNICFFTFNVQALTNYCDYEITANTGKKAHVSMFKTGTNTYRFVFESVESFVSYNSGSNFYSDVNGGGGHQVSANLTQDGNKLTWNITSNPVPRFYVGDFFVNYSSGEAHYNIPLDADWTNECSSCTDEIYFVNYQMWTTPHAHMWEYNTSNSTTWNGDVMTQVTGTTDPNGFTVWKATVASGRDHVIFNQTGDPDKLAEETISTCEYYFRGAWYSSLDDIPSDMMYFVNTPNWATPRAHLYCNGAAGWKGQDTSWPGVTLTNTGLTNTDGNSIYSFAKGDHTNVLFNQGNDDGKTDQEYYDIGNDVIFNYADNTWYRPHNVYLCGTMFGNGDWGTTQITDAHKFPDWDKSGCTITKDFDLAASTTYDFKVYTDGFWRGSSTEATITSSNTTIKLDQENDPGNSAHITTTIAGTYTFTYDVTTAQLTVTYPVLVCSGTRQHFNSTGPQINYRTNYDATSKKLQVIVESASSTMNMCNLDYRKTATGGETRVSMSIIGGVAVTTLSGFESTDEFHFRFHYSVVGTAGEYLTAEGTGNTDPGMIRMTPVSTCANDLEDFVTAPTTVPDDPDDLNDCEIFSLFGLSSFPNKGLTEFQFWDGSPAGAREFVTIDGKNVCYVYGQPAGKYAIMSNDYDVSDYDKFHVDLWTPNTGKVRIRLMGYSGGWQEATNYKEYDATGGSWLSIDANVSDFTFANSALALAHMKGLMIINLSPSMRDYHVANMYFYKSTSDESCYADCGVDVARGKNTWAGCQEDVNTNSSKAVDGTNDMWQTGGGAAYTNQWWVVDLGRCYDLDKIQITFENARTKHMRLQTRKDTPSAAQMASDAAWTTIVDVSGANDDGSGTILGNYNINEFDVSDNKARYIRFKSDENTHSNNYGCKIRMFKVCVTGVSVDDANPPTMVSVEYISNNVGNTGAILELHATDLEGDVSRFRLTEVGGGTTTLNTDASNRATLEGLTSGLHTYNVYAVDPAGNVSANYETLSFCFINPAENLAVNKTARSGWSRTVTQANAAEVPAKANDGIGGSGTAGETEHRQWGIDANFPTKAWWAVDLGQKFQLSNVDIYWNTGDGNVPHSYIIQVANETPADFVNDAARQNLVWETVKTVTNTAQNMGSGTANRNRHTFTVGNNVVARYVRIVNFDETRIAMYLREVEVYAHAIVCDDNAPTMVSAAYSSANASGVIVELHADDAEDGTDAVTKYKLLEMDGSTPVEASYVTTDAQHKVTITGLTNGTHTYRVYAIDTDGNISANYEDLSICYCDPTSNLALNQPVVAGYTGENAAEVPTKANDGNTTTHWTTYNDRPISEHWWSVDLGDVYQLSKVQVVWQGQVFSNHYLIQVAHVAPADRSDDLQWYTIREVDETQSGDEAVNEYNVTGSARYIRIKMLSREGSYISLQEFRVFGSACADLDNTAPTITSATVTSTDATANSATLTLVATDNVTSPVRTYIINNTTTGEKAEYEANASNQITLTGLTETCSAYALQIQAKDSAANISAVTNLSVIISPSTSVNLAPSATATAGHTEGISNVNNAIDGNLATQWQSTGATAGTNEWYTLDLGKMYDLNEVKIRWGLVAGNDDGGDYPSNFRLQVSDNNTTWASFAHYTQQTALGTWLDVVSTDPLPARYVRVWVDNHTTYSMGIREFEIYSKDECYEADGKPVITLAEVTNVNPTSVDVHCESWAAGKTHDQIRYYYELTDNSTSVTTTGTKTHTTGNFTFDGLSKGVNYTARIYAEIISGSVRSLNYKELTFSVTYSSLHYLTEETECNWGAGIGKHEWQFKYTDNYAPTELDGSGDPLQILSYTDHTIIRDNGTPPTIQYRLYEAGIGSFWTLGGNLYFRNPKDKHLIMYALGTEKFVCNLDELYVSGEAVGGWWTASNAPNSATAADYRMTYNEETGLFSWTGVVVPGADKYFKIVIRDIRSNNPAEDTWAFDRIMDTNKNYERDWTRATLYFDMQTWTWWWENAMGGCTREGGPGTHNKDNDSQAFTDGYKFDTYVQTTAGNDYLVIEAEPLDAALDNAGALHFYTGPTADVFEVTAKETKTYHDIDGTSHTYYRYKVLMSNIPTAINNIIRYCVKFEGPAGLIRITKYHYFDLENHECAPDFNVFYHSSDPNVSSAETSDPLDAVYEFDGGQLVQPILYRRKFDPGEWHSICIPFVVDSVRVWDEDDNCYYKLEPLWNNGTRHDADYWLRTFDNEALVRETAFKDNWDDPAVEHYVPEKDVPYIIRFPKGSYYRDKYVEFVGRWYQTIVSESAFSRPSVSTPGSFLYAGNNTMKRINMAQPAYYLNDNYTIDGQQYFVQRETAHTLMPFECYVVSDAETMTRVKIIGRRSQVITDIDNTEWNVNDRTDYSLYSVTGQLITTLRNRTLDEVRQHCQTQLSDGCYMLRSANLTLKIIVGGK